VNYIVAPGIKEKLSQKQVFLKIRKTI